MLPEKAISDALTREILSLGIGGLQVVSPWAVSAPGVVRNVEEAESGPVVEIFVGNRAYETPQHPAARFACFINLYFREELDPTGARLVETWGAIAGLLQRWQDDFAAAAAVFADDSFDFTAFQLSGGAGLSRIPASKAWLNQQALEIRGIVNSTPPPNQGE